MATGEFSNTWTQTIGFTSQASSYVNPNWVTTTTFPTTGVATVTVPAPVRPEPCETFGRIGERDNDNGLCQCGFALKEHPEFKERELLRMLLALREKLA